MSGQTRALVSGGFFFQAYFCLVRVARDIVWDIDLNLRDDMHELANY